MQEIEKESVDERPWVAVQDGIYRYSVAQRGGLVVRSLLYEYPATEVQWG
jgi:hypothetical protein